MRWKKVKEEMKRMFLYASFFFLFFSAFTFYRRLILREELVSFIHLGYNLGESLVLAKIILLGQYFQFGERFSKKPLIVPTLYKTAIFTVFVIFFDIFERFFTGLLKGHKWESIYNKLQTHGFEEIAAELFIMIFVFLFFFAFLEIDRLLGGKKLFDSFFRKNIDPKKGVKGRY